MNLQSIFILLVAFGIFTPPSSFGSVRPDYILAPIHEISNPAGEGDGSAKVKVTFWVQPCAEQKFEQFVIGDLTGADEVRHVRVGVLIYDSGIGCAGPTILQTKTLNLKGPFEPTFDIAPLK